MYINCIELNRHYLRARYYNQNVGRFTQMDTWMGRNNDPVTLHKYLYANVDPVNNVDPTGHFTVTGSFGGGGFMAGLTSVTTSTFGRFIGRSIAASFVVGKTVTTSVRKEIIVCRRTKGKKCRIPNMIVSGSDYPTQQKHILEAQTGEGSNGYALTPVITYKRNANKSRTWLRSTDQCKGKVGGTTGMQCDEYPFAASYQGGKSKYPGFVSLKPIKKRDNHGFGTKIWGAATKIKGVKSGTKFIIIPYGAKSFYVVNGKYGPTK